MARARGDSVSPVLLAVSALVASVVVSALLPSQSAPAVAVTVALLFLAILLLDVFDLSLPHGDRIGLDGPIVAAALGVYSPLLVLTLALTARAGAMVFRPRRTGEDWLIELATTSGGVAAAAIVFIPFRSALSSQNNLALIAVAVACAALLACEVLLSQIFSARRMRRQFSGLVIGNLRLQGPLLGAEMSASVLLALTYERMGSWALVLVVILLLLLRHSYALLIDVRQTYMNTVEVLVDTAELSDSRRRGHSERTAQLARDIAEEIGLSSRQVEQLSYGALLHDLDMVGLDPEDLEAARPPSARQAGRVLAQVGFLSEVVPLLGVLDGDVEVVRRSTPEQRLLSLIIALASDIDARAHAVPVVGVGEVPRVARLVGPAEKAKVIGATIRLGHSLPAVP